MSKRRIAINETCMHSFPQVDTFLEDTSIHSPYSKIENDLFKFEKNNIQDYYRDDSIFYNHPARLYRMFRLQSKLNLTIPESQIEYARYKWWLSNFVERDRIKIEFDQIKQGPNAKKSLELLKYAK